MMCPEGVRATRNTYLLTPDQYFLVCRTCEACQRRTDRLYPNGLTQARSKIFKGKPTSGQTFEGVLALVVTWNTGSYIARLLAVKTKARATALEESNQVRNHALESVRRATADAAAAAADAAAAALAYAPAAPAVLFTGSVGGAGGGVDIVSGGGSKGSKGLSGLAAALHKARGKGGIGGIGARMCCLTSSSAGVAAAAAVVATLAAPAPAWEQGRVPEPPSTLPMTFIGGHGDGSGGGCDTDDNQPPPLPGPPGGVGGGSAGSRLHAVAELADLRSIFLPRIAIQALSTAGSGGPGTGGDLHHNRALNAMYASRGAVIRMCLGDGHYQVAELTGGALARFALGHQAVMPVLRLINNDGHMQEQLHNLGAMSNSQPSQCEWDSYVNGKAGTSPPSLCLSHVAAVSDSLRQVFRECGSGGGSGDAMGMNSHIRRPSHSTRGPTTHGEGGWLPFPHAAFGGGDRDRNLNRNDDRGDNPLDTVRKFSVTQRIGGGGSGGRGGSGNHHGNADWGNADWGGGGGGGGGGRQSQVVPSAHPTVKSAH